MGTEAETVRPTRRARYTDEAPNSSPRIEPRATARTVSSQGSSASGTYGLNTGGAARAGWAKVTSRSLAILSRRRGPSGRPRNCQPARAHGVIDPPR